MHLNWWLTKLSKTRRGNIKSKTFFNWLELRQRSIKLVSLLIITILMVAVYYLVMNTGGIKFVFAHSMYVPIIFAGVVFGIRGSVLAALIGGLILGPLVPLDTVTGEPQSMLNWVYRIGFFSLIGIAAGLASDWIKGYIIRIRWTSRHDATSKLPNYLALIEDMERLKLSEEKTKHSFNHCLIIISLVNSEEITTNFGMPALNRILLQMAERVKLDAPVDTVVYRTRNDQLCLLLEEKKHLSTKSFCRGLHRAFQEPFLSNDLQLHGDVQLGVVKFQGIDQPPSYYIQKATSAVSEAKASSAPNIVLLNQANEQSVFENIELLGYLKAALDDRQLQMHYQPKIDLSSGRMLSVEALMRWRHPKLGNIPPDKFIPRAERSTLIDRLTEFAIDESLREVLRWKKAGVNIKIAVNISVQNLTQSGFVFQVMSQLEEHGLSGEHLEFELTENSLMHDIDRAIAVLTKLSKLGVTLSIDDFGTGYSSLQYLQKLPVSLIKIDKSFVFDLARREGNKHIVDASTNLAHRLKFKVVAEGVEDKESLDFLRGIGCDYAQGYLISRPLPANDLVDWYKANRGKYAFD